MRRREFIKIIVGSAAVLPTMARAQQSEKLRKIGVLMAHKEEDPEFQEYLKAFRQGLHKSGWIEGRNIQIDTRWGALEDAEVRRRSAKEILALKPDVVLSQNTPPTATMLEQTREVPVVFLIVTDPVGSGFVKTLSRPGGNATGFTIMEPTTSGRQWLELLEGDCPANIKRAGLLFNPKTAPFANYWLRPFDAAAKSLGIEPVAARVDSEADLETVFANPSAEFQLWPCRDARWLLECVPR